MRVQRAAARRGSMFLSAPGWRVGQAGLTPPGCRRTLSLGRPARLDTPGESKNEPHSDGYESISCSRRRRASLPARGRRGGEIVKKVLLALAGLGVLASVGSASTTWSLVGTYVVASSSVAGGGYPVPPGSTKPLPGTCGPQMLNSNHSESWLAVKPGTEDIVGDSKFFIGKWSTFYDFHLGSYTILNGAPVSNNQVQGYECTTVGTQNMPPSWTMNTDPNVDWDTQGRAYMTTLPFNAFWEGGLHPNGEIDVSYSDDLGRHWVKGNGGKALDSTNNQTSLTLGHVEDKEWIAVNHIFGNVNQDHV